MALCLSVDVCFVKRDVLFFPARMSRKLSLPTELKPDLGKPWSRVIQTICMEMQFISLTSTGLHRIPLVQSYLVIGLRIGKPCGCSLKFAWDKRSTDLTSNPFFFHPVLNGSIWIKSRALPPTHWPQWGFYWSVVLSSNRRTPCHCKALCKFRSFLFLFCALHVFSLHISDWSPFGRRNASKKKKKET